MISPEQKNNIDGQDLSFHKELKYLLDGFVGVIYYLLKNRKIIFINFILTFIISVIVLLILPNVYTAKTSFVAPPPDLLVGSYRDLNLSVSSINIPNTTLGSLMKDPTEIYIELLQSRVIEDKIIDKFDLMSEFKVKYREDLLNTMNKNIVKIKNNRGIIEIDVETKKPELSYKIANQYIVELSDLLNNLNVKAASIEREFLEKRLEQIHQELNVSSKELANFQENKKVFDVEKQGEMIIKGAAELQTEIIQTEAQLNSLKVIYNENSPKVKSLEEKLKTLKGELDNIKGKKTNINSDTISMAKIPSASIDYFELLRNVKIKETVFEVLSKQLELVKLKEAKEQISLKIVDKANIPTKKSGPKKTITLIAISFGIILLTIIYLILKKETETLSLLFPDTSNNIKKLKIEFFNTIIFWKKIY